jgi:hypothetical protein
LPFPDAKGPAGLITAQLKQTPQPPSSANQKASLPAGADRVILKCLEKDKNNRWPDVTQLSNALQEVINSEAPAGASTSHGRISPPELLETRKGEMPNLVPPPMPMREHHPTAPNGPHATPGAGIPVHHAPVTPLAAPVAPSYPMVQAPYGAQQLKPAAPSSNKIIWWIIALLALGAAAGAVLALAMK